MFILVTNTHSRDCYINYISLKVTKRLGAMHKAIRTSRALVPRRYLAGLSLGASSAVLAQLLDAAAARYAGGTSFSDFDMLVVHVDTDLSGATGAQELVGRYRERFPGVAFRCVHLSAVLDVRSVDWGTLPLGQEGDAATRLRVLFERLPTVTARADILRLFIRHILLHIAISESYSALLLGHSTTSLAALTLSEVANGRGFAIPWQVNDGLSTVCTYAQDQEEVKKVEFPVYYPLREAFRNEILQYVDLIPALEGLVSKGDGKTASVVSHKDLSIDEVMTRYFASVEDTYSGIVSNVVRTTGKLDRSSGDGFCGSCGMPLDEQGDSRWAGELGDDPGDDSGSQLCYGCKRSIHG